MRSWTLHTRRTLGASPPSAPRCAGVVNLSDDERAVRHSKDPSGPVLAFAAGQRRAFLLRAKTGDFDAWVSASPYVGETRKPVGGSGARNGSRVRSSTG
ncbi:DUF397 domain-containing protein [Streptosporangium saharense]|uniref:DUF397 domain-containing protein n=1 Tax=Streptosporangium saharense TaxID=1706840 RepID=UPI0036C3BCEE